MRLADLKGHTFQSAHDRPRQFDRHFTTTTMKNQLIKTTLLGLSFLLALGASSLRAAQLEVVTSFSILADVARQVGGDHVEVTSLIGPNEDAHGYQPKPSDARLLGRANLVIANGLGFDPWIERLAPSAGHSNPVVIASKGIDALDDAGDHGHHGHDHGPSDPHAWQDVSNVRHYARNIARALERIDPTNADAYRQNAATYDRALEALDAEIRSTMSVLPVSRRKLVTSHDAFGYFGKAYGISVIAAAGISDQSEPSAAGIARLIRQLRREKIPVVFIENINDARLIERIAQEGGARLGGKLFSDALSEPDGSAPTYIEMMRHNLATLMDGLIGDNDTSITDSAR